MAKQKYQRRDSGLLIPGNDSIQVPKARAKKKPWFVGLDPKDVTPKPFGMFLPAARMRMSRRKCCCVEPIPCRHCPPGNTPQSLLVEISGITAGSFFCGADCTNLNGSYVLDFHGEGVCTSNVCKWIHILSTPLRGNIIKCVVVTYTFLPSPFFWILHVDTFSGCCDTEPVAFCVCPGFWPSWRSFPLS